MASNGSQTDQSNPAQWKSIAPTRSAIQTVSRPTIAEARNPNVKSPPRTLRHGIATLHGGRWRNHWAIFGIAKKGITKPRSRMTVLWISESSWSGQAIAAGRLRTCAIRKKTIRTVTRPRT